MQQQSLHITSALQTIRLFAAAIITITTITTL